MKYLGINLTGDIQDLYKTDYTALMNKIKKLRDFLGGPEVKTLLFQCRGWGFNPQPVD